VSGAKRWAGYGDDWPDNHRPCLECGKMLPFCSFHKHKNCKFGVNSVCKSCRHPKSKKGYADRSIEEKLLDGAKQRAKQYNRDFNITLDDIKVSDRCPVLGKKFIHNTEMAPSLDRVDNSLGYIRGNIMVISRKANTLKSSASIDDIKKVLEYMQMGVR